MKIKDQGWCWNPEGSWVCTWSMLSGFTSGSVSLVNKGWPSGESAALVRQHTVYFPALAVFDSPLHHVILPLIKLMGISLEVYRPISTSIKDILVQFSARQKSPVMIIATRSILPFNFLSLEHYFWKSLPKWGPLPYGTISRVTWDVLAMLNLHKMLPQNKILVARLVEWINPGTTWQLDVGYVHCGKGIEGTSLGDR